MTFPPLKNILIMYAVAVGLLWVATRIFAPIGYKFSILRGVGAAFLMSVFGNASLLFLNPRIGYWHFLVTFLAYIIVVRAVLKLDFWRCILAALIYFAGGAVIYYFLFGETS